MTALPGISAADLVATARIGQVVENRYHLLRLLGTGGMGTVYEARHTRMGRRFAVKFLRADLGARAEVLARFQREALAAGALDTEHVVEITDFGATDDGGPYLVMEYLSGEDVGQLLAREGPLPVPRAITIALDACRGLAVAHGASIVHRDLKPANLFLARRADGSEVTKILDFGIAKMRATSPQGNVTLTGATLGTPYYMAPEQVRDTKEVDHRVDVYALGVVLYELLSGQRPHPGEGYNTIVAHILTELPVPLASLRDGLPEGLVRVVARAMAALPGDRYQTAADLGRELSALAGRVIRQEHSQIELRNEVRDALTQPESPTQSGPPSVTEPWMRQARWRLSPLAVALVASGFALLGGAVGWQLDRSSPKPYGPICTSEAPASGNPSMPSTTAVAIEVVPSDSSARPLSDDREPPERRVLTAYPRRSGAVAGRPSAKPGSERESVAVADTQLASGLPRSERTPETRAHTASRVPIDPSNPYE